MDKFLLIADAVFELLPIICFAGLWYFVPESRDTVLFLYLTMIYTKVMIINRKVNKL